MGIIVNKEQLLTCCGSRVWVDGMWAQQPFSNRADLLRVADEVWKSLSESDWLEAFSHHPRIGGTATGIAQKEQSGIDQANEKIRASLVDGNRCYEEQNGFIFLICATGKSAEEMLATLVQRLQNDRSTELAIAVEEQAKIIKLRLEKMLG